VNRCIWYDSEERGGILKVLYLYKVVE
jgi:hypothetical protein